MLSLVPDDDRGRESDDAARRRQPLKVGFAVTAAAAAAFGFEGCVVEVEVGAGGAVVDVVVVVVVVLSVVLVFVASVVERGVSAKTDATPDMVNDDTTGTANAVPMISRLRNARRSVPAFPNALRSSGTNRPSH